MVRREWLDTPQARGWLLHRADEDSGRAEAPVEGFVAADARVLARLQAGRAMPVLGFDEDEPAWPDEDAPRDPIAGLYAICDSAAAVARCADAGLLEIQLRIKSPAGDIEAGIEAALRAVEGGPARLWINDHWRLALAAGARALHLGQEDWAALTPAERTMLRASGAALGISSHSPWELARARGIVPSYVACGPIHATTTKQMPWRPQGVGNLAWWVAHAGRPVVAIGGLLTPQQVGDCAAAGASAACIVRALDGGTPLRDFERAWRDGVARRPRAVAASELPQPTLAG